MPDLGTPAEEFDNPIEADQTRIKSRNLDGNLIRSDTFYIVRVHGSDVIVVDGVVGYRAVLVAGGSIRSGIQSCVRPVRSRAAIHIISGHLRRASVPLEQHGFRR
jgi:hypothetical protein